MTGSGLGRAPVNAGIRLLIWRALNAFLRAFAVDAGVGRRGAGRFRIRNEVTEGLRGTAENSATRRRGGRLRGVARLSAAERLAVYATGPLGG
ncbi:hypothetical protein Ade02nite_38600 [Paractinoplanes deccanensis]|uniref:Uncharacterized protein n=1 Tax=Paractinoplanes deccanensis TaxID=113561 RepID=A0ABQ3Y5E2_9ACTN|nr:hypothetical protein Ade02nite_38600 [Actinoplanes deccanensis]